VLIQVLAHLGREGTMGATRGKAKKESLIVPVNWTDVSKSVRRRAGWNVSARLLDNPPEPTRGSWPVNACRHTCASVEFALFACHGEVR
jgi:hypothetical protein